MRSELCSYERMEEIKDYYREFKENDEIVGFLEFIDEVGVEQWLNDIMSDSHTSYYLFYIGRVPVGMFRITPAPNYDANGMIGYSIRRSQRGKGYACLMLSEIIRLCVEKDMIIITACVAEDNVISSKVLTQSLFEPTGNLFRWINGKIAIEYARDLFQPVCSANE